MSEPETSFDFEFVVKQVARIWTPAAEAIRMPHRGELVGLKLLVGRFCKPG
jgi:hypothetical protein